MNIPFKIALLLALLPTALLAEEGAKTFNVEGSGRSAKVYLRSPHGKLDVSVIDQKKIGLPKLIQVSLFRADGTRTDLEVSAVSPDSLSADAKNRRQYTGSVPASESSFIGAAIRIPLSHAPALSTLKPGDLK